METFSRHHQINSMHEITRISCEVWLPNIIRVVLMSESFIFQFGIEYELFLVHKNRPNPKFIEPPRLGMSTPKRKGTPNVGLMKQERVSTSAPPPSLPGPNPLSLFTGLGFGGGMFPPFVDMSSTQALIALVSIQ